MTRLNDEESTSDELVDIFGSGDTDSEARRSADALRESVMSVEVKRGKNGLPRGVFKDDEQTGRKAKRLTPKMQSFASYIVQGMSPTVAYLKAYNSDDMAQSTIVSNANRLLKDERITLLLESYWNTLKENVIADQVATKRHIMAELFKHASDEKAQLSNRLKSLELLGKSVGMFTDKVESKVEEISVDALKKELQSSLDLLESKRPTVQ